MVINLEQTSTKFKPGSKSTLANGEPTTNATFANTLQGEFVPIQLIYGGKISKNLARDEFLESFSLSINLMRK